MSAIPQESVQVSPEVKRRLEEEAQRLHLTVGAYLAYLMVRGDPTVDASRLDRMVDEVFGKHGEAMRRLAK